MNFELFCEWPDDKKTLAAYLISISMRVSARAE
jgi:hypothetical protein